ncbi:MAG: pilus assembly protein PilM [Candidatus Riflebacteria bacterium]|nr:pilus assembly protein PilM [Candidatus Riflebacteria bacterium]
MADSTTQNKHDNFVAIDIGAYSVKFVYIERNEEGEAVLKTLAQILVPPYEKDLSEEKREQMSRDDVKDYCLKELRQLLTTHITELLYDNEIQTKKAVTFASNREVTIRCIEVPPANEKEKNKFVEAINQEANKQMPFSMGNAVLGYSIEGEITRENKPLVQIMAAALQKDTIELINGNLKGGGLTNDAILTLPQSLQLSLKHQLAPFAEGDKKVGIIHCGHTTTSVMIFKNNKIQFYRDINMAGGTITDTIYAGGEIDGQQVKPNTYSEATELKHNIGVIPPDNIEGLKGIEKFAATKIFETVEKIFQNIQLSISFYISQSGETNGLDQIILTGGTAYMKNFKEFIEESLEVPTALAEPFTTMQIGEIKYEEEKRIQDSATLSPVLGAGLYQDSPDIINFIDILFPNKNRKSSSSASLNLSGVSSKFGSNFSDLSSKLFQLDENKLRILAVLILIILIAGFATPVIIVNKQLNKIKADYNKMNRELSRLKQDQSEVDRLLKEQENLKKYANLSEELKSYKILNTKLIIKLLSLVPQEIFITDASFNLNFDNPTVVLNGHADNSDSVFTFLSLLSKENLFRNPVLKSTKEIEIDQERYFIRFEMTTGVDIDHLYQEDETAKDKEGEEEDDEGEDDGGNED